MDRSERHSMVLGRGPRACKRSMQPASLVFWRGMVKRPICASPSSPVQPSSVQPGLFLVSHHIIIPGHTYHITIPDFVNSLAIQISNRRCSFRGLLRTGVTAESFDWGLALQ